MAIGSCDGYERRAYSDNAGLSPGASSSYGPV